MTILGAGAIGCLFGALFSKIGHDVTFVTRGDHLRALRKNGLIFRGPDGVSQLEISSVADPGDIKECDLGILVVKAKDTYEILEKSRHLKRDGAIFLSFQNIMEKEEILAKYFGRENVIGAVTNVGASIPQPGILEYTECDNTFLGEYPEGTSNRVKALGKEFVKAGFPIHIVENVVQVKWVKLVWIAASGGVAALTRVSSPKIFEDVNRARLIALLLREGADIMLANGVEPRDYPGIGFKSVLDVDLDGAEQILSERGINMRESGVEDMKPSMLGDVLAKRRTEAEHVQGYLLRKAKEAKLAVPTIEVVYSLLRGLEEGYLHSTD